MFQAIMTGVFCVNHQATYMDPDSLVNYLLKAVGVEL